jgi:hypothetical protein
LDKLCALYEKYGDFTKRVVSEEDKGRLSKKKIFFVVEIKKLLNNTLYKML